MCLESTVSALAASLLSRLLSPHFLFLLYASLGKSTTRFEMRERLGLCAEQFEFCCFAPRAEFAKASKL